MYFITVVPFSYVDYLLTLWIAREYTALNDRMIGKLKACGRRLIKVLFRYLPGRNEERNENPQDSYYPGRNSKRTSTEYESKTFTDTQTLSVQ
jgi:hypothetical protein